MDKTDIQKLKKLVQSGWVTRIKHPKFPIYLCNYSSDKKFKNIFYKWNKMCKSLIVDENYNILKNPSFYLNNKNKLDSPSISGPFEVWENVDGFLGIVYSWEGKHYIATRRGFRGKLVRRANEILHKKYSNVKFNEDYTYIVKVVTPIRPIFKDYGDLEDIFLIGCIHTGSMGNIPIKYEGPRIGLNIPKFMGIKTKDELKEFKDTLRDCCIIQNGDSVWNLKSDEYRNAYRIIVRSGTGYINAVVDYVKNNYSEKRLYNLFSSLYSSDSETKRRIAKYNRTKTWIINWYKLIKQSFLAGNSYTKSGRKYKYSSKILECIKNNRPYNDLLWSSAGDEIKRIKYY